MKRKTSHRGHIPQRRDSMTLRIISGSLRRRALQYRLDERTRPMKDRIRQAVFNLIGQEAVRDRIVLDLFAGTGLLALEAISRGALRGTAIERLPWLARQLRTHCQTLGIEDRLSVVVADTFRLTDQLLTDTSLPWLVFVCPPYAMVTESRTDLQQLVEKLVAHAAPQSTFVIESEERDPAPHWPDSVPWEDRIYRPTRISIFTKSETASAITTGDGLNA